MARNEVEALRKAVDAAKTVVKRPIIDDSQGESDAPPPPANSEPVAKP